MIRWTCGQCGYSGLYSTHAGGHIACRNCHATAMLDRHGQPIVASRGVTVAPWRRLNPRLLAIALGAAAVLSLGTWAALHLSRGLPPTVITDLSDPQIAKAVGLLVPTVEITLATGRIVDQALGAGACFVVGRDGTTLTSRRVVQNAVEFARAPGKPLLEKNLTIQTTVRMWVFIGGEQMEATVLSEGEGTGLAVLKLPSPGTWPHFSLAEQPELIRGDTVFALGFRDLSLATALSSQDPLEDLLRKVLKEQIGSRLRQQIESRDLEYTQARSSVSRITKAGPRALIEHEAVLRGAHLGAPLVTPDGKVVGVNVSSEDGLNHALPVWELRDEISKHVSQSTWR